MLRRISLVISVFVIAASCAAAPAYGADSSGNIQLEAPTQIQFRLNPQGRLISPSSSSMQMSNKSDFEIRISAVKFVPSADWNVVADASTSSLPNSISLSIGPEGDKLDAADCVGASKKVGNEIAWTMSTESDSLPLSKIDLETDGSVSNVTTRGSDTVLGSTEWYITSDTTTNEIRQEIADLQAENQQLRDDLNNSITNISRDGTTFTATKGDGTTFTFDQKDDNTTYSAGTGLSLSGTTFSNSGVTGVKGNSESSYRTGQVNLTAANIGAAASSHIHNYITSYGTVSGSTHAAALQSYFNSNKSSLPRNALIDFYSSAYGNGSLAMGYFLSGYDSNPYGGFFVAHYNNPKYVGIQNGSYYEHVLLSDRNYTSYCTPKRTVLYNSSGTNGNVTLSSSAANFNHMKIYVRDNNSNYGNAFEIYSPNGKNVWLNVQVGDTGGMTSKCKKVLISGTTISNVSYEVGGVRGGNSVTFSANNEIYIYHVEAWNE